MKTRDWSAFKWVVYVLTVIVSFGSAWVFKIVLEKAFKDALDHLEVKK